jgi:hypothetical protein
MTSELPAPGIRIGARVRDLPPGRRWVLFVVPGTLAALCAAAVAGGVAGLAVGIVAIVVTLSGDLRGLVRQRSRGLHDDILSRLEAVSTEHTDAAVEASSHDPLAVVRQLLREYRPPTPAVASAIRGLEAAVDVVRRKLDATNARRLLWESAGPPELIGGLAGKSDGLTVKQYGDPANLQGWLRARRARAAALQVGRVLDDVRLLNTARTESMVLTFTLWARALLLALAPTLGALSVTPVPSIDAGWARLAPWLLCLAWALATALAAPRLAVLVMEESRAGRRARCVLLAVELPLAVAVALTNPGWPAVAFAAGWTNWWVRIGPSPRIPDFSWARASAWALVTAGAQLAGLMLGPGGVSWSHAAAEIAITLLVVIVIADTYGAMLPVYVGVAARVLFTGARHQRRADAEARRVITNVVDAIDRAGHAIAALADRTRADDEARELLRRARESMLAVTATPRRRGQRELGAVVTAALGDGGYDMWADDPRAITAREHARREGRVLPVVVARPQFASTDIAGIVLDKQVAAELHRLLVACIVEARVHGARRVQTIVRRSGDAVEVRVANQPNPQGSASGGGRGGREILRLAHSLPGAGEVFRGRTDRGFVGAHGDGELFGVRFTFTVSDTGARGPQPPRSRVRRRPGANDV